MKRDPRRQKPDGERRAETGRKHSPCDVPAQRQRRDAPEERDQAERVLALAEDQDGRLLEQEPARRRDLAVVERAQEARQRALDDVEGEVSPRRPTARRRPRTAY
jgi:hypothetical protein